MASKVELKTKTVVEDIKLNLELSKEEIVFLYDTMRSIGGGYDSPRMYANNIMDKIRSSFSDANIEVDLELEENYEDYYYDGKSNTIHWKNGSLATFEKEVEQIFSNIQGR